MKKLPPDFLNRKFGTEWDGNGAVFEAYLAKKDKSLLVMSEMRERSEMLAVSDVRDE